jgi:hypothetical protein
VTHLSRLHRILTHIPQVCEEEGKPGRIDKKKGMKFPDLQVTWGRVKKKIVLGFPVTASNPRCQPHSSPF